MGLRSTIASIRHSALGLVIAIAMLALIALFIAVIIFGGVWVGERVLPWLIGLCELAVGFNILVLLPLAVIPPTRQWAGLGFFLSSYVFGLTGWFMGLLLTYILWGPIAVIVGLLIMGIGVVPTAMLATLFNGMWPEFGMLVLAVVLTYGLRLLGSSLSKSKESRVVELEERKSGLEPQEDITDPAKGREMDYTSAADHIARIEVAKGRPLTEKEKAKAVAQVDKFIELTKQLREATAKADKAWAEKQEAEEERREQERLSDMEELKALETQLEAAKKVEALIWVEQAEKYTWGESVPQDYGEAAKWYRKAAEHGDAAAQYNLAVFYDEGKGVGQDFAEAVQWYRKAAEQGYASAQNNLGACYYAGQGVPQDNTEAVKWYRKAAEQGHADAEFNLAYCYEFGKGVPEDQAEAHNWYSRAAVQGHTSAQNKLDIEHYQNITFAFGDLIASHRPLIGDCSVLPYPKKKILYAIEWLLDYYSDSMSEERYDRISPTLRYLLTVLARDWHDIDPEDKDPIAALSRLGSLDSFPDWALPLKQKYINEQEAREEALDATMQVWEDRIAGQAKSANPSDPDYGSRNKLVTKAEYEVAIAELKEILSRMKDGTDPAEGLNLA